MNTLTLTRSFFLSACFAITLQAADLALMPLPSSSTTCANGGAAFPIDTNFSIALAGSGARDPRVQAAAYRLTDRLSRQTGIPLLPDIVAEGAPAKFTIIVESRDHSAPQRLGDVERYSLAVNAAAVRLTADGPLGVLRGMETFLQLVQENTAPGAPGFSAACVDIRDEPRFPWRGLSLDVSRHFLPVNVIKRNIDGLAAVKLNVLHWHLSDDQGFRVESRKYPRLQKYGSDGLFYTQAEVRDILAYARDRGVRIVPEFDMPGHATSWLPGYPVLGSRSGQFEIVRRAGILSDLIDPTKESTYRFLDGFVGEMAKLFPDEYFHIGGDEVDPKQWNENPAIRAFMRKHHLENGAQLQVYFSQRLLKIVTKHHKRMEGWDEVLQPNLPKDVVIQSWRGQKSLWQAAREGYRGILSAGYYLDLMYPAGYHYSVDPMKVPPLNPDPEEPEQPKPGAPVPGTPTDLTAQQQQLILGGEAAMWVELASYETIDSRLWPRLAAIAERLWSPESTTGAASMYSRLAIVSRWLDWLGLTHRTALELMRQRLAGTDDRGPLDALASVVEPVKGYSRHAERYSSTTPLNRLVDAVPPESDAARDFRAAVRAYVAKTPGHADVAPIRQQLEHWQHDVTAVRPMLLRNSVLNEDIPLADNLASLCKAGLDALTHLDGNKPATADWKQQTLALVQTASQRQADLLIQISPAITELVNSVQ